MSEPRSRRRGRGIDAIFDATDLQLEPRTETQTSPGLTEASEGAVHQQEERDRPIRRGPGRPKLEHPPARELVQRGFYLEPKQDRIIDEIKVGLKGRGFNADRSAIIRAAVEYFRELDRFEQEQRVRRSK
ncbi:MAG: hypothetical protein JOZ19_00180 [Rubrobacter sp.]|nr:hypothetical protein [Rubrobacter sp.]